MSLISLCSVSLKYGLKPLLVDADLSVQAGDSIALVGRNGCGKTSLLKLIAGLNASLKDTISSCQSLVQTVSASRHC